MPTSQPIATRPLAIQKDGTWYTYGLDLTKNVCEVFGSTGYIATTYTYSPYGSVTASGSVTQPIQWSSEVCENELGMVYYNWRYYHTINGRFSKRDSLGNKKAKNLYNLVENAPVLRTDFIGFLSVNDVHEIADQTETARLKNVLMGINSAVLSAACSEARLEVIKALQKKDLKKAQEWEKKRVILCDLARKAAKACLGS